MRTPAHLTISSTSTKRHTVHVRAKTCAAFCLWSILFLLVGIGTLIEAYAGTYSPDKNSGLPLELLLNAIPHEGLILGILFIFISPFTFAQCFQKIVFEGDVMTYHRPFLPIRQVQLSSLTWVGSGRWKSVLWGRRMEFVESRKLLCSFVLSYFKGKGLAFVLEQVRTHSIAVIEPSLTNR